MMHKLHTIEVLGVKVMHPVSGKVAGSVVGDHWFPGIWLGAWASSGEYFGARSSDGIVVRTKAVNELPTTTTIDDLNEVARKPWAPTCVVKGRTFVQQTKMLVDQLLRHELRSSRGLS